MSEWNFKVANTHHGEEMKLGSFFFRSQNMCAPWTMSKREKKDSQVHSFKKAIASWFVNSTRLEMKQRKEERERAREQKNVPVPFKIFAVLTLHRSFRDKHLLLPHFDLLLISITESRAFAHNPQYLSASPLSMAIVNDFLDDCWLSMCVLCIRCEQYLTKTIIHH